ncbi:YwiC-like family protein [Salipaludibacillus sp. CUR1]|uniref:YwiC-like family protein n=1 Tax=Salipaludibacillus sp. CUR1 TaxID=2820003 RepID=UPI001E5BE43A|nr:YwiC-like family protein [Salipaludibacillus sp. CUR1]MCE7794889.1 YwiC-like family protein [Salipaludibacillus sp. CUR1]
MKWYIPREHGAWAMFIVPYWIGAVISGLNYHHLLFFAGLTAVYFAQAPLLTFVRQPKYRDVWPSFFVYAGLGSLILIPYILSDITLLLIGLSILPLFCINIFFAKIKKERSFLNDAAAITALAALLLFAYQLGKGTLAGEAYLYTAITIIYFIASVFHVKSLIREKKNMLFRKTSYGYHILITFATILTGWFGAAAAFFLSTLKTIFLPEKYLNKPMSIGIVEIANSLLFFIFIVTGYYI